MAWALLTSAAVPPSVKQVGGPSAVPGDTAFEEGGVSRSSLVLRDIAHAEAVCTWGAAPNE